MRTDALFLASSIFSRFYEFSKKADPFLVRPTKVHSTNSSYNTKKDLPITPLMMSRIEAANDVIN